MKLLTMLAYREKLWTIIMPKLKRGKSLDLILSLIRIRRWDY